MKPYNVEIFTPDFMMVGHTNINELSYKEDYLSSDENSITVFAIPGVAKQDYIRISRGKEEYAGVVTEIAYGTDKSKNMQTISYKPLMELFNADMLFDVNAQGTGSFEQFIADSIKGLYIENEDTHHTNHNGNDDLEKLHHDSYDRHGDLGVLRLTKDGVQSAILPKHIIDGCHRRHQRDLRQEAASAKRNEPPNDCPAGTEAAFFQPNRLHMAEIPNRKNRCQDLSQHRGDCGAHHTPAKTENEQRVQDNVDHGACQCGDHGEFGAAIGADNGVHGLTEHIERDTQGNPEEVFPGLNKGLLVDSAAKGCQNLVRKNQVDRC